MRVSFDRIGEGYVGKMAWAVFLVLTTTSHAFGQQLELRPSELKYYEVVRLTAPALSSEVMVGKVVDADSTHLVLLRDKQAPFVVQLSQVEHVEVKVGKNRLGPAVLGFTAGAVAAGVGFKLYADAKYLNDEWNEFGAVFMAAPLGGLVGAVVGASIGSTKWVTVQVAPWTGGGGEEARHLGLRMSVRMPTRW